MDEIAAYYATTQKAFGLLAPFYNIMTLPLRWGRRRVVEFAGAGRGALCLDVATGTGQQAFAFAKAGCTVIGVDLTDSMLRVGRKHNRGGTVRFEAGDATHLRFKEDTFDVTCISFALHDMPSSIQEQVLREMQRVTKPNGTLIIVDYGLPRNKLGRALVYRLIRSYERGYYRQFIVTDLAGMIADAGIHAVAAESFLSGAGRIIRGIKTFSTVGRAGGQRAQPPAALKRPEVPHADIPTR